MVKYRNHMKIIGDVLSSTDSIPVGGDGAPVTHIIKNANVSHVRIVKILGLLVSQGLLEQVDGRHAKRYKISHTGKEFLREYQEFVKFSENFGLSI